MSRKVDYIAFLAGEGNFESLPQPTAPIDVVLYKLCEQKKAGIGVPEKGERGATIRITTTDPGATEGFKDGDLTLNKTTWHVWQFEGSDWTDQGSIKGDSGLTAQNNEADLAADATLPQAVIKLNAVLGKLRAAGLLKS